MVFMNNIKFILNKIKWLGLIAVVLVYHLSAHAADELYLPGLQTRCFAMGGTCSSHVRGAAALFFNPAALARVQGFDFIVAQAQAGISKDTIDFSSQFQGGSFSAADLDKVYGKTLAAEVTARSGFVMPNFGFGVFSNNSTNMQFSDPTFPTFNMSFLSDYGYILGGAFSLGGNTSFGFSARHIKRWGGTEEIDIGTIIGSSSDSLANSNFQDHGVGHALDISIMTTLNHSLKPTLMFVWQDLGVTTFTMSSGSKPPPSNYDNLIFGASIQQEFGFLDLTHAFEYKFIRTNGYDLSKKLHLGTEMSLGPLDLRAGVNQGYITYGVGIDLWLFQLDAAAYATELGTYASQARSDRYNVSLTFSMDFDQSFKMNDSAGRKRRLKQRR